VFEKKGVLFSFCEREEKNIENRVPLLKILLEFLRDRWGEEER